MLLCVCLGLSAGKQSLRLTRLCLGVEECLLNPFRSVVGHFSDSMLSNETVISVRNVPTRSPSHVCFPSPAPHSCLPCSASSSSEPLEEHQVAQLLRRFSNDPNIGHPFCLDSAFAHHLHQCSYHLRLFRNWLISGQDPLEYIYGQPCGGLSVPCCAVTAVMAAAQLCSIAPLLFEACCVIGKSGLQ